MLPIIYHYTDPRNYLVDAFNHKRRQNPLFSVRALSKQMGFRCHSSLVFLFNGKRRLRPVHVDKIVKGLKIGDNEEKYFRALVHLQDAKAEAEKSFYENQLRLLHPAKEFSIVEVDRFRMVADWLHMAILEMTRLQDFSADPAWIKRRLFFPVESQEISDAITRLINLKLLKRIDRKSVVKTNERLTTPKDFATECIREHHKQVLRNALRAIDEQSVEERFFNSCAMTIDASRLPEAKTLMRKFREEMTKLMEKDGGDQTYQLNIGFYKLTKTEKVSS